MINGYGVKMANSSNLSESDGLDFQGNSSGDFPLARCWATIPGTEWFAVTVTVVCTFGIVGNILNLFILTRQQLLQYMDRMEKSANIGLVALALSDLMFCIAAIPAAYLTWMRCMTDQHKVVWLYVRVYSISVINMFFMISTWLVVAMAISRYIAVCHPLRARETISVTKTRLTTVVIYILSALMTGPHFAQNIIKKGDNDVYVFVKWGKVGYYQLERAIAVYVRWVWPVFSDFIPFVILAYCNACLIWKIRHSDRMRRQHCPGQRVPESSHRVTLTLIIIIIMHFILVSPAEIMKYANPYQHLTTLIATLVANVLQTFNFAANFILYISVSRRFRQTTTDVIKRCFKRKKSNQDRDSKGSSLLSTTVETWL